MKKTPKVVREPGHALTVSKDTKRDSFTYADYLTWPEGERWEIIDGEAFSMSSPGQIHQEILLSLATKFFVFLEGKPCKVFVAPFDVRLKKKHETDKGCSTVIQPDLMVVCAKEKLDGKGVKGNPDLVVEIVSPSNARHDLMRKFNLYELHQIKEYWIIHPEERYLLIFQLDENGRYGRPENHGDDDRIKVSLFPELTIETKKLWQGIPDTMVVTPSPAGKRAPGL